MIFLLPLEIRLSVLWCAVLTALPLVRINNCCSRYLAPPLMSTALVALMLSSSIRKSTPRCFYGFLWLKLAWRSSSFPPPHVLLQLILLLFFCCLILLSVALQSSPVYKFLRYRECFHTAKELNYYSVWSEPDHLFSLDSFFVWWSASWHLWHLLTKLKKYEGLC